MQDIHPIYKSPEGYQAMMAWYEAALERLPVACESRLVGTRCGETHVLAMGSPEAPPLIMIHGLGGCAPMWSPQMAMMSQRYRVYAIDTIGQPGKSAKATPPFSGGAYVEWLTDLLDGLNVSQTRLVGLSLGGWLTLKLCMHAPERVSKAVLISTPGLARLKSLFFVKVAPAVLNLRRMSNETIRKLSHDFLAPIGSGVPLHPDMGDAMILVLRHYNLGGYSAYRRPCFAKIPALLGDIRQFLNPLPPDQLRRVTMPTYLLLAQYESLFDPQAAVDYARQHLPNLCAAEVIPNAGHGLNYDQADLVNARLLEYLQD